jgi:cell division protein FtsB
MNEATLLTIALSLVAVLFGLLVSILAWIGGRLYNKLDEIVKSLGSVASELHGRINTIDRRVTVIEAQNEAKNGQ